MSTTPLAINALASCNLEMPPAAATWLHVRDSLPPARPNIEDVHAAAEQMTPENVGDVVSRLTTQRIEADTREVVTMQLRAELDARCLHALRSESDSVIGQARKDFDKAARQIVGDAERFNPNDSTEDVLRRGTESAAAWTRIQDASATLDRHLELWTVLYSIPHTVDAVVKSYDGDHWRRVDAVDLFEAGRWHALVAAGYTLRLNTLTEMADLIKATPEKSLRSEMVRRNGFSVVETVRQ